MGGSYGECPYTTISENIEKISQNNKAWSTRKSATRRNTLTIQSAHNSVIDDLREEMVQMRFDFGLVLKDVAGGAKR